METSASKEPNKTDISKIDRELRLVEVVLKCKLAKNEEQALYLLTAIAAFFFIFSGYLFWQANHVPDYVILPSGTKISAEQYVEGLKTGKY
jgi:hypothetical protein